jgi:hypothetical protein
MYSQVAADENLDWVNNQGISILEIAGTILLLLLSRTILKFTIVSNFQNCSTPYHSRYSYI